jgi:hypothetical protein
MNKKELENLVNKKRRMSEKPATPRTDAVKFDLIWHDSAYYVSVPNILNMAVVPASEMEKLEIELSEYKRRESERETYRFGPEFELERLENQYAELIKTLEEKNEKLKDVERDRDEWKATTKLYNLTNLDLLKERRELVSAIKLIDPKHPILSSERELPESVPMELLRRILKT